MTIKKAYYYLFFKLIRFFERSGSIWLSHWKAGVSIGVLEVWLWVSVVNYYTLIVGTWHNALRIPIVFGTPILIFVVLKWFCFLDKKVWGKYVKEFGQWPKKENRIGGLIVWLAVFLIIANTVLSYYLLWVMKAQISK